MARFVPLARIVPLTTIDDPLTTMCMCGLIDVEGNTPQRERRDTMGMTMTGSGIVLVGYSDTALGIVACRDCAERTQGATDTMEAVYSPDVNEDTPTCFACGVSLDA
jgi:hypothetical protein